MQSWLRYWQYPDLAIMSLVATFATALGMLSIMGLVIALIAKHHGY